MGNDNFGLFFHEGDKNDLKQNEIEQRNYYKGTGDLVTKIPNFENDYLLRYNSNGERYSSFAGIPQSAEEKNKKVIAIIKKGDSDYYFEIWEAREITGNQERINPESKYKTWNAINQRVFKHYDNESMLNDAIIAEIKRKYNKL